jgi:hypothetical protein
MSRAELRLLCFPEARKPLMDVLFINTYLTPIYDGHTEISGMDLLYHYHLQFTVGERGPLEGKHSALIYKSKPNKH